MLSQPSKEHPVQNCVLWHQQRCGEGVGLPFCPVGDFPAAFRCAAVVAHQAAGGAVGIGKRLVENLVGDLVRQRVVFPADSFGRGA